MDLVLFVENRIKIALLVATFVTVIASACAPAPKDMDATNAVVSQYMESGCKELVHELEQLFQQKIALAAELDRAAGPRVATGLITFIFSLGIYAHDTKRELNQEYVLAQENLEAVYHAAIERKCRMTISDATRTVALIEYYRRARAELADESRDENLWSRVLAEVDGNEAEQREMYVQLRGWQLYSKYFGPIASTGEVEAVRQATIDSDVSGVYLARITSDQYWFFNSRGEDGIKLLLNQTGSEVVAVNAELGLKVIGTIDGGRIDFHTLPGSIFTDEIVGKWEISEHGAYMLGNWETRDNSDQGKWDLVKIVNWPDREVVTSLILPGETNTNDISLSAPDRSTPNFEPAPGFNLTGTYVSEITTNTHWVFHKRKHRSLVVEIEQDGNQVTGFSESANMKISGMLNNGEITFFTWPSDVISDEIKGKWTVSDDGRSLEGRWTHPHGDGKWNLRRIE